MSRKYKHIMSPLKVGGVILKSRLLSANALPHFLQGPESYPADSVITHYANKAKSGAAIVTCMGINNFSRGTRVPMEADFTHFPDFDLYDPASQNYLMQMVDAIHYHNSIACMGIFVGPPSGYPLEKEDGSVEVLKVGDIAASKPITQDLDPHNQVDMFTKMMMPAVSNCTSEHMDFIAKSSGAAAGAQA